MGASPTCPQVNITPISCSGSKRLKGDIIIDVDNAFGSIRLSVRLSVLLGHFELCPSFLALQVQGNCL